MGFFAEIEKELLFFFHPLNHLINLTQICESCKFLHKYYNTLKTALD